MLYVEQYGFTAIINGLNYFMKTTAQSIQFKPKYRSLSDRGLTFEDNIIGTKMIARLVYVWFDNGSLFGIQITFIAIAFFTTWQ